MHRTRIKICGIRDADSARAAADAGADAIGLIFVPGTPRHVASLDAARRILGALPAFVEPVALFVDAPLHVVRDTAHALGLRTVQLHGREGPGYVRDLQPLRVIKSIPFDQFDMHSNLVLWRDPCPNLVGLVIDSPPLPDDPMTKQTGGHGTAFDWNALASLKDAGNFDNLPPMILAGGLNPGNIARAVQLVQPFGVDVSSGVEQPRGVKDPQLIRDFCAQVHHADAARAIPTP